MGQETFQVSQAPQTSWPATHLSTPVILGSLTEQLPPGVRHVCVSAVSIGVDIRTVVEWVQLALGQPPTGVLTLHNLVAAEERHPNDVVAGVVKLWRRRMKTLATITGDLQRWTNFINAAEKRSRKLND